MARPLLPHERLANDLLDQLRKVGPQKPMGYLPLLTIQLDCSMTIEQAINEATEKGLSSKIVEVAEGSQDRFGSILCVWDNAALASLLEQNKPVLDEAGWPSEPESFVSRVLHGLVPEKTAIFDLISDAFGDHSNHGRLRYPKSKKFFRLGTIVSGSSTEPT